MITRYCLKCGKQITLDDSQPFGFCTYCGTRIELAPQPGSVSSGADPLDAEIQQKEKEAQAFVKLGNWEKARELMLNLANEHPDSGRAWLAFGMVYAQPAEVILAKDIMRGCWGEAETNYRDDFPFTTDTIIKWLSETVLTNARKMLREDEMLLYQQRVEAYQNSLKEEFRRSERIIDDFIRNPMPLAGYIRRSWGEYENSYQGFFEDAGSLYYANMGVYNSDVSYVLRFLKSESGKLIFELIYMSRLEISRQMNRTDKKKMIQVMRNTPRYWEFQPAFASERTLYLSLSEIGLQMDKAMADEHLRKPFNAHIDGRIKAKQCPICGSDKGLFGGCIADCMSLFKQ